MDIAQFVHEPPPTATMYASAATVATVREFLAAELIDIRRIAVAPNELGEGERVRERPEELTDRFHLEQIPGPSGVVHHFFWRR
ncbi:hypothetical protein AB0M34_12640 [Nocardia sp. NPDC050193]